MEQKLANFVALGLNYRQQTKLLKGNVFTPVCHSVHGGGSAFGSGVDTPWTPSPLADTPWADTPPDGRYSGRYAFYWNAFLFYMKTARKQTICKVALEKFCIMHHRDIANCQLQIMTILMFVTMLAEWLSQNMTDPKCVKGNTWCPWNDPFILNHGLMSTFRSLIPF